ncbi:hypothetical protein [Vibrio sinaloensis]|uniref:hypothetical protein n=1 Tax=Photobacterium sp. (strain ATCC 43367) TaxID=379097 RepID=UPI00057FF43B|nr:hypothetical protein [Vibrio sinaloensis]KHT50094.1 membrane protein [Vibrio sinaloensis]
MQNTIKCRQRTIALAVSVLLSSACFAEENSEQQEEKPVWSDFGGSLSLSYDTNIYHPDDYRSVRSLSWSGSLNYTFSDNISAFMSSGGYRAYENETGDFATDSVIGASYSSLYEFGETGKIGANGQFTIPTSEASRKDELQTAFRLAIPVSMKPWGVNVSITPRLRKNFHKYKTAGGRSLTEWTYSVSSSVSKSWESLTLGISALGGNTISYQGTRRTSWTYGGSLFGSYRFTDNWSASLSASTSGVYQDAERGTLGNIDLFDQDNASYRATVTFSF